ncbi:MAG: DUF4833 domain-containing protein [Saprospiraceae bacterium]|nr:DUF4833 domain-containing protein [Saprospiraceae bacterium]
MILNQLEKEVPLSQGEAGRPAHYPNPEMYPNRLFYIQRNHNTNAVIYEANLLSGGLLNLNEPIKVNWIQFDQDTGKESIQELNHIQKKLAYGYHFKIISNDLIQFEFVSYGEMKLYLVKSEKGTFEVVTKILDRTAKLTNIYVYAEDLGVFPQVKFAELYGIDQHSNDKLYQKLLLQM